ncbi:hypothetical protein [Streptomyces sp. NPDC008092]|uniref:hypothetical protein n=1 Tax=Streptomyces sp. NPDC008092 TaxID=3364808 RepID=UPI0036EBEC78
MTSHNTSKEARADQIDRALRGRITDGTWPPGHAFTWEQITEEFSIDWWDVPVILSPALRRMRLDGLIESRPYIGVRVVIEGKQWSPPPEYAGLPHDQYIETMLRQRLCDAKDGKGFYRPGEKFASLADLSEEFGVSTATAKKATDPLKRQGILVLIRTNRTHVSPDLAQLSDEEISRKPERLRPGTMLLPAFGEKHTLADWSQNPRCVVDLQVLYQRYVRGWDLERALKTPKVFSRTHAPKPWVLDQKAPSESAKK